MNCEPSTFYMQVTAQSFCQVKADVKNQKSRFNEEPGFIENVDSSISTVFYHAPGYLFSWMELYLSPGPCFPENLPVVAW